MAPLRAGAAPDRDEVDLFRRKSSKNRNGKTEDDPENHAQLFHF
jgi:hypothetical protein